MEESPAERQKNELKALHSIFSDNVKDLRLNDKWKVKRPPELLICLKPQQSTHGSHAYVSADLYVKCTASYPDVIPELELRNTKGLSTQHIEEFNEALKSKAEALVGEVMLYELCTSTQSFLHEHNHPPVKSFYEEMLKNKQKQKDLDKAKLEREEHLKMMQVEQQRKAIEQEKQRRQEALKQEERQRREINIPQEAFDSVNKTVQSFSSSPSDASLDFSVQRLTRRRRTSTPRKDSGSSDNLDNIEDNPTTLLTFNMKKQRNIHKGKSIGHSAGNVTYIGLDASNGEMVTITEWTLKWRQITKKQKYEETRVEKQSVEKYVKQVQCIEQELLSMLRLRHPNLIHYLGMEQHKQPGVIHVSILAEYVGGHKLAAHIQNHDVVPLEQLRQYTQQILEALKFLHNHDIVHRDLHVDSVFLDHNGKIRLTDYSIAHKLYDLHKSIVTQNKGVQFSKPVFTYCKSGKKADVYKLGVLLLSLLSGEDIQDQIPTVPQTLPSVVQNFINNCLSKDDKDRWSVSQLLSHSFIRTPIPAMLSMKSQLSINEAKSTALEANTDEEMEVIPFIPNSDGGQSRLTNEFEILIRLGKGAFGDVIKVRNKLDGRLYAIKRIPINPKSSQFTKKITREVKLLSRLSHENVVRYYNSWIEISDEAMSYVESPSISITTDDASVSVFKQPINNVITNSTSMNAGYNSLGLKDDIEAFVPQATDVSSQWEISSRQQSGFDSSSSDDSDMFGQKFFGYSDSDGVVFDHEGDSSDSEDEPSEKSEPYNDTDGEHAAVEVKQRFLYIQMEFCEKSTLRNLIDDGLYENVERVWQLFREIIEGLYHIHQQGMIHRDLKPVNVFLDSNDHVKIGDFGLATTNIINKDKSEGMSMCLQSLGDSTVIEDESMTGAVGTALYVSPEVMSTEQTHYTQKVDIYSLGIMFFEMCYRPLATGMERHQIIYSLRKENIEMPDDFVQDESKKDQIAIIQQMLNHDANKRLSSKELLQSDLLPPLRLEEEQLNDVIRSTVMNPGSRSHRHLLNNIFTQKSTETKENLYDLETYKYPTDVVRLRYAIVRNTLVDIFHRHGAVPLSTPLLMPPQKLYALEDQYVQVMDHGGGLVALPYDLRIPFARYIARHPKNALNLKRYSIDRVYKERKLLDTHPKEALECAFDIVTSSQTGMMPDAEVINIVNEIINEYTHLQNTNYHIRLNHTLIVRGILLYYHIPIEKHSTVCSLFNNAKMSKTFKQQVLTELAESVSMSDSNMKSLYDIMQSDGQYTQVASNLRRITKSKSQDCSTLIKRGLKELETITAHLKALGCQLQVRISLSELYKAHIYSGMLFRVVADIKRKKKQSTEILAAGGRYDELVHRFSVPHGTKCVNAVGVSLVFERIVYAAENSSEIPTPVLYDVVVHSLENKLTLNVKLSVLKLLWDAGIHATLCTDESLGLEGMLDYCRDNNIQHIILLKENEPGHARVRSFDKDAVKMLDKKLLLTQAADYIQQKLYMSRQQSLPDNQNSSQNPGDASNVAVSVKDSTAVINSRESSQPNVVITLILDEQKHNRKRYETQISNGVTKALLLFSNRSVIHVLGVDIAMDVLRSIAAEIEMGRDEEDFESSTKSVIDKHQRFSAYLNRIFEQIKVLKCNKRAAAIILYNIKTDLYKVLL